MRLYIRVIWRFRILVAVGLLLALLLSFLSFVRVSFEGGTPKFAYRQSESWQSHTAFVLTGPGFAVGDLRGGSGSPLDLAGLAAFYARMAQSDDVQRILLRSGPAKGVMDAQPGVDRTTTFRGALPFISIIGTAQKPSDAVYIARRGARAFQQYLVTRQETAGIPAAQRVQLRVINAALGATLIEPRKKTLPIVIFVTIMMAAIGLAFVFENLRPRVQLVGARTDAEPPPAIRRSA